MNLQKERLRLIDSFKQRFGPGATPRAAIAPGRSNLIGEHTDYNLGLVLPIAVNRHTIVLFRPTKEQRIRVYSETLDAHDEFDPTNIKPTADPRQHWANYVRGVAAALRRRGIRLKGGDLYVTADLPRGAGLSSSASLEMSTGRALLTLARRSLDPQALAFAGQEAEHRFAGVMCGIMDQTAVSRAREGHALLLDCQSITVKHIPIKLRDYDFAIFDTGVRHKLAASEYNVRRRECEHAAHTMKHKSLRSVTLQDLLQYGDTLTASEHRRVRHVISENQRVVQFAAALRRGDVDELGRLLRASHESLANDYQVSCKELDCVVAQLAAQNAKNGACPGARMTGAGFGGAVVALIKRHAFSAYAKALKPYAKGGSLLLTPASGVKVVDLD